MSGLPAARSLARWALGVRTDDIPATARAAAVRHLLDGVGCAIGGVGAGTAAPALIVATALGGPAEATAIGRAERIGAPAAALANGTLVHALDFDDTHAGGLVHATAMVLPAALAVAEQVDASGSQLLDAAVVGYEAACRLAAVVPNAFHDRGLHPTAVCGVFSSALVAARLTGMGEDETVAALGIAGSMSGGLLEFLNTGSSTKQLHPGFAAQSGILAARLAAAGASGPDTVLEGRFGLYAALLGIDVPAEAIVAGLGESWQVEHIGIKPYPACQLMHVTLDAASAAVGNGPEVVASDIVAIEADVHPDSAAIVCEPLAAKITPRTPYDAKFSLPWSVAALLIDGEVGTATYQPANIARPDIAALAERVRVNIVDRDTVAADAPGRVSVTLADGSQLVGAVARSGGGPADPLTDAALDAKFLSNCPGTTQHAARDVIAQLRALAAQPSVRAVAGRISEVAAGHRQSLIDQEST